MFVLLNICFIVVMLFSAIVDWKSRIVNNSTWILALIFSLAIAKLLGYGWAYIIVYMLWLSLFFILCNIIFGFMLFLKNKTIMGQRNKVAADTTLYAENNISQNNVDNARSYLIYASDRTQKSLSKRLDLLQNTLNRKYSKDKLIDICLSKLDIANKSKTMADIYIVEAFLYSIPGNIKLAFYKKIISVLYSFFFENQFYYDKQKREIYNNIKDLAYNSDELLIEDYAIGGGDIRMAPAVTLFYGPMGLPIVFIITLIALIWQKIFKLKDNAHIPFVTFLFIGCLIKICIEIIYIIHAD